VPTTPSRALLLALIAATLATALAGWWLKIQCATDGVWDNLEFYQYGCYSDAYPFWRGHGLSEGKLPYLEARIEYPVLTGAVIGIEGMLTRALFGGQPGDPDFVTVVSAVNAALAVLVTWLMWGLRLPAHRLWAWAFAPPLLLYVGHNWDMVAVALALLAFVAAERGGMLRAVALAAAGTAAKLFPVLLLPLFALRDLSRGDVVRCAGLVGLAITVWGAINFPVWLAAPAAWWEFYDFSAQRLGTTAATWDLLNHYGWLASDAAQRNRWSLAMFLAGAAAILALGWRQHRDRLWLLAGPVLVWFLLSNKVYSPQFDLWAYPFLLIAAPRWQPVALFTAANFAGYWAELWWFAAQQAGWGPATMEWVLASSLLRAAAGLWLIADALRLPLPAWLARAA
jgi:uncharacterized membrane protein